MAVRSLTDRIRIHQRFQSHWDMSGGPPYLVQGFVATAWDGTELTTWAGENLLFAI